MVPIRGARWSLDATAIRSPAREASPLGTRQVSLNPACALRSDLALLRGAGVLDALLFAFLVPASSWRSAAHTGGSRPAFTSGRRDARMANTKIAADSRFEQA